MRRLCFLAVLVGVLCAQRGAVRPATQPWPRAGIVVAGRLAPQALAPWGPVWYYQYGFDGPRLPGHQRVYLVPVHYLDAALVPAVRAHPGAWWLVGNEPNDPHQDDMTPATYAAFYARVQRVIARHDPTARVVPAGIADADWRWAEAFRASYRAQYGRTPRVAAWNIHNYILAPGSDQYDVAAFQERILAFRAWMARSGAGALPLLLTEYGVLYGSGCCGRPVEEPAAGIAFMRAATRWLAETDHVQAWTWFSLDARQFNGALLDAAGQPSAFGLAYRDLVRSPDAAPAGER